MQDIRVDNAAIVLLLLAAAAAAAANGAVYQVRRPRLDGRIVGGSAVDIKRLPYQVSLQRSYHFCGGSLIAKRIVVTAAHCTAGSQASAIKVRVGATVAMSGGRLISVRHVHRHPQYNAANIDYDFSILELNDYDTKDLVVGYVQLPSAGEDVPDGATLVVSGWGNTQNANESNSALRLVTVPKVSQQLCEERYAGFGGITDRMLCAGFMEGGKDACQGDSGGPLVVNDTTLVGVVSWGYGCAKPNYPGVYARVAAVRDWIRSVSGI